MSDIPVKVDIPSQEIEFDIEKAVMECFKTAVMAMTSYWEEGTRNRILETCEKEYLLHVHSNLTVNDIAWNKLVDAKAEYNGMSMEQYVKKQLVPEVDQALVNVAKHRKTYPYECAKLLAKQCSNECSYEQKLKAEPEFEELKMPSVEGHCEVQHERFKQHVGSCADMSKTVQSQIDLATELRAVKEMISQCRD